MELIRSIKIERFRSIAEAEVTGCGAFNVFVGKNSSGKSNLLRALNLFFNGEVEPGKTIEFSRDYFQGPLPAKKKKRISITVDFRLPTAFRFRKGLEGLEALGAEFSISRAWELDERRRPVDTLRAFASGKAIANSPELARQFLGLISYRYIPNRTNPADLLRFESQAIADSIFMRMKGDQHAAALLEALTAAATRMLGDADAAMQLAGSPLTAPRIALATSLGEMLTMSGFQATSSVGANVQDEDWGSGHQAFFLYLVLHALDTNYGRFFGWRQATVWGLEEPESALHRDLETRLADCLRQWTDDDSSRLQCFATTHSPIVTMAAQKGFWTEIFLGSTAIKGMPIPQLTRDAETRGVSGWVHPVLSFPWNPVVLVEGPTDVQVLHHVAQLLGQEHLRFLSLPGLDPSEVRGGQDAIVTYLKRHQSIVQNRPSDAPLIVLFDWDAPDQTIDKAKKAYGAEGERYVLRMDDRLCDKLLSADFKGIERFYPPDLVLAAHRAGELIVGVASGKPYSISMSQLGPAKHLLCRRLLEVDALEKLQPLAAVIAELSLLTRNHAATQLLLPGLEEAADVSV